MLKSIKSKFQVLICDHSFLKVREGFGMVLSPITAAIIVRGAAVAIDLREPDH